MFISAIHLQINHLKLDKNKTYPTNEQAKSHLRSNYYPSISNDLYLWQTNNLHPANPSCPQGYTPHKPQITPPSGSIGDTSYGPKRHSAEESIKPHPNSDPTPTQLRPNADLTPT